MSRHSSVLSRSPKAKPARPTTAADLPKKPYPDFPLHPTVHGYWAKKIRGKIHHFGRWARVVKKRLERLPFEAGYLAALAEYERQRDALQTGRTPTQKTDGLTVRDLCNRFLTSKQQLLATAEITGRTFSDYRRTTDRLVSVLGKDTTVVDLAPEDFEKLRANIAATWGPVALGNEIQRTRTVFKLAYDNGWIDRPMRTGQAFKRPSRKVLRKARAANGVKLYEPDEIRRLLSVATPVLRAMILLGVGNGLGNADIGNLCVSHIDFEHSLLDYPRPKTGIARRSAIWPETLVALERAIELRPEPKDKADSDLVFVTKYGGKWAKDTADSPVCKEFAKLLDEVGLHRHGAGFYDLRRCFRTFVDAANDPVAIDLAMGHHDESMGARYRQRIDDSRLLAVSEFVRKQIFYGPWPFGGDR
jgi:integrase